ncbi:hypothetical protein Pcinc_004464 [Petrolisthes cinctipes]|uniref:Uncharacterized protein n=1 Tax=Petrolisthes cinctipes TaxID=88211 RepID=A0AAE1L123_PETCI|nr:hypothetical protein Pcinc_004464 [Petrolisthes cinctipes]
MASRDKYLLKMPKKYARRWCVFYSPVLSCPALPCPALSGLLCPAQCCFHPSPPHSTLIQLRLQFDLIVGRVMKPLVGSTPCSSVGVFPVQLSSVQTYPVLLDPL